MPSKLSWILELPRIQEELEALNLPVVDRACSEKVFGLKRRRAIFLMKEFGGYQAGRTLLVDRRALLQSLRKIARSEYEPELARKTRLVEELEKSRKLQRGRLVKINVPPEVREQKISDLPAGVHLRP